MATRSRHDGGMNTPSAAAHTPDIQTDERLTALEIKSSYAEDLLDTLNSLVARQQDDIDRLKTELGHLQRQLARQAEPGAAFVSLRDELPPHY
jgi:SlyX protein